MAHASHLFFVTFGCGTFAEWRFCHFLSKITLISAWQKRRFCHSATVPKAVTASHLRFSTYYHTLKYRSETLKMAEESCAKTEQALRCLMLITNDNVYMKNQFGTLPWLIALFAVSLGVWTYIRAEGATITACA